MVAAPVDRKLSSVSLLRTLGIGRLARTCLDSVARRKPRWIFCFESEFMFHRILGGLLDKRLGQLRVCLGTALAERGGHTRNKRDTPVVSPFVRSAFPPEKLEKDRQGFYEMLLRNIVRLLPQALNLLTIPTGETDRQRMRLKRSLTSCS